MRVTSTISGSGAAQAAYRATRIAPSIIRLAYFFILKLLLV